MISHNQTEYKEIVNGNNEIKEPNMNDTQSSALPREVGGETMTPQSYYTLKMSYLSSIEYDLRQMRRKLNELHIIEKNAAVPEFNELEDLDKMYLNFLSTVQRLRTEAEPRA